MGSNTTVKRTRPYGVKAPLAQPKRFKSILTVSKKKD